MMDKIFVKMQERMEKKYQQEGVATMPKNSKIAGQSGEQIEETLHD